MTGFNHALAGTAIALAVRNPLVALVMAMVSHFALDVVPHFGGVSWFHSWNRRTAAVVTIDTLGILLTLLLSFLFITEARWLAISCALVATAPDWPWLIKYIFKKQHWYFTWHQAIQRFERPWGIYVEACFAISLVFTLTIMHN